LPYHILLFIIKKFKFEHKEGEKTETSAPKPGQKPVPGQKPTEPTQGQKPITKPGTPGTTPAPAEV